MEGKLKIFVDIDGTICTQTDSEYEKAEPIIENITKINKLFDEGHIIVYWTSRGTTSGKEYRSLTLEQLHKWGCKYSYLMMGKAPFDLLIDDKTKRIEEIC
jgi:hypothetical protein